MPDYRLIHRRALRGEKIAKLTDFERGVWLAYLLVADDYGVMPFDAGELSRAIWLKGKPQKTVQRALERIRDAGLIQTWLHQGAPYCYAYDWQEWQNVRHPRGTIEPCPPPEVVATCKPKTRGLFAEHARISDGEIAADCGNISEESPQMPRLAGAGGRETLTLTQPLAANAHAERPSRGLGAGVMGGALPRDHVNCHQPCERMCISERQHGILRERHGGTDADLDAFYADVRLRLDPSVPIGDKPWNFWDTQFSAKFGAAVVVNPRTAGNAAAAARFVARGQK